MKSILFIACGFAIITGAYSYEAGGDSDVFMVQDANDSGKFDKDMDIDQ